MMEDMYEGEEERFTWSYKWCILIRRFEKQDRDGDKLVDKVAQGVSELPDLDVYLDKNDDKNTNRYYENKIINDNFRNESKNNEVNMDYDGKDGPNRKVYKRILICI
jgi:hypothetical protein